MKIQSWSFGTSLIHAFYGRRKRSEGQMILISSFENYLEIITWFSTLRKLLDQRRFHVQSLYPDITKSRSLLFNLIAIFFKLLEATNNAYMTQIIFFLFEGFPSGCSLITRSFHVSSQVAESFLKLRSPSTFFSHLKAVFELVLCYL